MEILLAVLSIFVCTSCANPLGLIRQRRQETDCQMRFRINQPDWSKPVCNYDGSYRPYQCEIYSLSKCWCVYDNGMMIPDSAQDLNGDPTKQFKQLKCAEKKAKAPPAPNAPAIETPFTSRRLGWHLAYRDAANQATMCPQSCGSPCPCTPGQMYYPYSSYNNYDPYTSQMQQYGCPQPCPQPCPCQQPSTPPFYPPPPPPPPPPMPVMSNPSSYQQMTPNPAACPVPCPAPCSCQQVGFPSAQTQSVTPAQDQEPKTGKSLDEVSDEAPMMSSYSDSDVNAYNSDVAARNGVSRAESGDNSGSGNHDDIDDDDNDDGEHDDDNDDDDDDDDKNDKDREQA